MIFNVSCALYLARPIEVSGGFKFRKALLKPTILKHVYSKAIGRITVFFGKNRLCEEDYLAGYTRCTISTQMGLTDVESTAAQFQKGLHLSDFASGQSWNLGEGKWFALSTTPRQ